MTPTRFRHILTAFFLLAILLAPAPAAETGLVQKLYENALQLLRSGKSEEALKAFQQIYEDYGKSPQAPDALYQAGSLHYPAESMRDLGEATREKIRRAHPLFERIRTDHRSSARVPQALLKLGLLALEPENPQASSDEAYASFTSIVNIYPDSPLVGDALFGAALSEMRNGAYQAASEDFSRLLEQVPNFAAAPAARLALGYALYQEGDSGRAMEQYQEIRNRYPGQPEAERALERLTLLYRLRIIPASGAPLTYRRDTTFPGRLEGLGIRSVKALAIGPESSLLVADYKQGVGYRLDHRGHVAARLLFPSPSAAAVTGRGEVVLAGAGTLLLGKQQQPLGRPNGTSARPLRDVVGIGVDRDGRIYVADGKVNEVLLFGPHLDFQAVIHRSTAGRLGSLKVGMDNRVYVLDTREKTVTVYTGEDQILRIRLQDPPASINEPVDLAIDHLGDIYVIDGDGNRIVILEPDGKKVLATLEADGTKGGLSHPSKIEVDEQGRIYVFDRRADAILRFH